MCLQAAHKPIRPWTVHIPQRIDNHARERGTALGTSGPGRLMYAGIAPTLSGQTERMSPC